MMKLNEYNKGDTVEVLMNNAKGEMEWRKAIVLEKRHVNAGGYREHRHGAYDWLMVKVKRTYYKKVKDIIKKGVWVGEKGRHYTKLNTEGLFNPKEIRPISLDISK